MSISVLDSIKFEKIVLNSNINIDNFFVEFSKFYIKSPKDFLTVSGAFFSKIAAIKDSFKYTSQQEKYNFEKRLKPFCLGKHRMLNPTTTHLKNQSPYVNMLSQLISPKNNVLDVGGGAMPYSSILMKDYFQNVGAMDKFCISEKALSVTGITAKNCYFNSKTPIDNYDYIVGRTPCTAIESIVENCHQNNKGYLIKLCNCDLDNIASKNDGIYRSWTEILPEIDPSVKFDLGAEYAFNLDITKDQFQKVEVESKFQDISSLKNSFFGELQSQMKIHNFNATSGIVESIEQI